MKSTLNPSELISNVPWALYGEREDPDTLLKCVQADSDIWKQEAIPLPLITLISPTWNTEPRFLEEMIQSCLLQSYSNWELLLIDDASPQAKHIEVIEKYLSFDSRIRFARNSVNLGISGSRNRAIEMAKGDYIAILDHDDLLHPMALAAFVRYLRKNPAITFLYCNEYKIDSSSRFLSDFFYKPDFDRKTLLRSNYIAHLTFVHHSLYQTLATQDGFVFNTSSDGVEDHDVFYRLTALKSCSVAHLPIFAYAWRKSATSTAEHVDTKPYVKQRLANFLNSNTDSQRWIAHLSLNSSGKWPYLEAIGHQSLHLGLWVTSCFTLSEIEAFLKVLNTQRGNITYLLCIHKNHIKDWERGWESSSKPSHIHIVSSFHALHLDAVWYEPAPARLERQDSLLFVCQTFEEDPACAWIGFQHQDDQGKVLPTSFRFHIRMRGHLQLEKSAIFPYFQHDDHGIPCVVAEGSFFSPEIWQSIEPLAQKGLDLEEWDLIQTLSQKNMNSYYAGSHCLCFQRSPQRWKVWSRDLVTTDALPHALLQGGILAATRYDVLLDRTRNPEGQTCSDLPFRYKIADRVNGALKSFLRPLHSLIKRRLAHQLLRG